MMDNTLISREMMSNLAKKAAGSPRKRMNLNFHSHDTDQCHRFMNALEPSSYLRPHCHTDPTKAETVIAVKGSFGAVFFDSSGNVTKTAVIRPDGDVIGVNIPHLVFHCMVALEAGSVFFESKAGPYKQLTEDEKGKWAPDEGSPGAHDYLEKLRSLFISPTARP